ncbi:MAG: hypothetical protein LiPW30_726 [Parcubacteria group bacterium LiPW_30]|nr:MAG: hypothetical protein LiPW30_726 [Parcubacteria group bacterium LiPW_30]
MKIFVSKLGVYINLHRFREEKTPWVEETSGKCRESWLDGMAAGFFVGCHQFAFQFFRECHDFIFAEILD